MTIFIRFYETRLFHFSKRPGFGETKDDTSLVCPG
jgi:hypothetical protein